MSKNWSDLLKNRKAQSTDIKNVNVYTHSPLSLSLSHAHGGGRGHHKYSHTTPFSSTITFALGPRQATVTIPYSSSSVGYLMTSSALWGNGGTGLCHGRVKGPCKPWAGRKRSGQIGHLAFNTSQSNRQIDNMVFNAQPKWQRDWSIIWILVPVTVTDR